MTIGIKWVWLALVSNIACIAKLESRIGQVEKLFRAVEDLQQNDIPKLVDRVREWESMENQIATIKNFLRLNRETLVPVSKTT